MRCCQHSFETGDVRWTNPVNELKAFWSHASSGEKCTLVDFGAETCCTLLAENTGPKKVVKNRHLGTIPQLCRAISSQLMHVSTIGKKLVKQQYGELRPTNGWDRFGSLGRPYEFQRVLCLGSVTARYSSSGRQPNFAALNRGCHLYSAGRPSRWALAHILGFSFLYLFFLI